MSSPLVSIATLPLSGDAIGAIAIGRDGTRAYVSRAGRFEVIDLEDPTRPRRRGHLALGDGNPAVDGDHAAVAGEDRVELLDVRSPDEPIRRGGFDLANATDVAIAGDVVVATDGEAVRTWRVAWDRGTVTPLGRLPIELAGRITLADREVYVAADFNGMIVVDVADPARPIQRARFAGPGDVCKIAVAGAIAYLADYSGGLNVVDLSVPARPRQLAEWDEGLVGDVAVAGGRAYLAMGSLVALDVGDPASPRALGASAAPTGDVAWRLGVAAAHVVALGEAGLTIWRPAA